MTDESAPASQSITTSSGDYVFAPVRLYHGRKPIDRDQALSNLLALQDALNAHGINFGLIYGTLLGAVRDGDFIAWDEDADVYVHEERREAFHDALWTLREAGLELIRHDGDLYSVMRNGDYIDVYLFRQVGPKRVCNQDTIDALHLTYENRLDFRGTSFFVPADHEGLLRKLYGSDWRTPRRDSPARPYTLMTKVKIFTSQKFPWLHGRLKQLLG